MKANLIIIFLGADEGANIFESIFDPNLYNFKKLLGSTLILNINSLIIHMFQGGFPIYIEQPNIRTMFKFEHPLLIEHLMRLALL